MNLEQKVDYYKNMVKLYKFDYLTGMKMKRDFEHETREKFKNQEFYLAMFDIVGLHAVNREVNGIAKGDELIRKVADDISYTSPWECYRIGGDEFMALYFEEPNFEIENTTMAYINSKDFSDFTEMIRAVDEKVTELKIKMNRRRDE
jgi:GGDEF domain-containing protein